MARPKTLSDNTVIVRMSIPSDHAVALDGLALVTGESKASHVRRAVARYLAEYDLNTPNGATSVISNRTKKESTA